MDAIRTIEAILAIGALAVFVWLQVKLAQTYPLEKGQKRELWRILLPVLGVLICALFIVTIQTLKN